MPPLAIEFTGRFRDTARTLSIGQIASLEEALRKRPAAFGQPHVHQGLGIRRLKNNYFGFRVGRDIRVVFTLEGSTVILRRVGRHDQVRDYLKSV